MTDIQTRPTVETMFQAKLRMMQKLESLDNLDCEISDLLNVWNGHRPYHITWRYDYHGDNPNEKYIDRVMWKYLVRLYRLEKYMLCTEYEKMMNEIESCSTPDFTPENANGWLAGLRGMIYENVRLMCKRVYEELITRTYHTGTSWNSPKKKRNNNGVDSWFIIRTEDYSRIFGCWFNKPTVTDDLEKVCYLLDGKTLPERTVIDQAKIKDSEKVECPYFSVRFCQNGNTHYKLTDETRRRLNRIGPDGNLIGEDIRIKVFEDTL